MKKALGAGVLAAMSFTLISCGSSINGTYSNPDAGTFTIKGNDFEFENDGARSLGNLDEEKSEMTIENVEFDEGESFSESEKQKVRGRLLGLKLEYTVADDGIRVTEESTGDSMFYTKE